MYTRLLSPFYKVINEKTGDIIKGVKVGEENESKGELEASISMSYGENSKWFNEAARALGKIEGLNLILVRPGLLYGDYVIEGRK